MHITSTMTLL